MTALVIEGVSTQDLDEMDEARCGKCGRVAVAIVTHAGCPKSPLRCESCVEYVREQIAARPESILPHAQCGALIGAADFTVRPI